MSEAAHQDITIFSIDDDDVPVLGTFVGGEVVEATFSTNPDHPRPYLKLVTDLGESEINFLDGGSVIGQLTVEIGDFPTDLSDQDSGIFTSLLSTVSGDTALLGVRAIVREAGVVIFNGVIGPVTLPRLTTFRIILRDPRERELKLPLFNRPNDGTAIFPTICAKEGWGYRTEYDDTDGYVRIGSPAMPRVQGVVGRYNDLQDDEELGRTGRVLINQRVSEEFATFLKEYGRAEFDHVRESGTYAGFAAYRYSRVLIEWSPTGAPGTYKQIGPMIDSDRFGVSSWAQNVFNIVTREENGVTNSYVLQIRLQVSDQEVIDSKQPTNGSNIWVRVVSNDVPDEQVPLFLEEPLGLTLKKVYDGDYTKPDTMIPIPYHIERMDELVVGTEFGRARITGAEEDARAWVQPNLYVPMRMAPSIRNGKIYPVEYEIPNEDSEIFEFNNNNTLRADWGHAPDNVLNQVIVEYPRETVTSGYTLIAAPGSLPRPVRVLVGDGLKPSVQRVIKERNRLAEDSQRRHGTKPLSIKPITLRSVIASTDDLARVTGEETGNHVFQRLGNEVLRRLTNGAQVIVSEHPRSEEIDALQDGDWAKITVSYLPNYVTGRRSMNRLVQIIKSLKPAPHKRGFVLLDAGPFDQPIEQPTLGTIIENDDGSVTIQVNDVPTDGQAEVQYALGEVEPDVASGQWRTAQRADGEPGHLEAPGFVVTESRLPPGRLLWVRTRGTANGRIASGWTNPVDLRLEDLALIDSVTVIIDNDESSQTYGRAIVFWDAPVGTLGVRIKWEIQDAGAEPPAILTNSADYAATAGIAILPDALVLGQQIVVQIRGYPGWTGSAVSGTAGSESAYIIKEFHAAEFSVDDFREIGRDEDEVIFGWSSQGLIDQYWVFLNTVEQPVAGDPWPSLSSIPTRRLTADSEDFVVEIPPDGWITYGVFVPLGQNGQLGKPWVFTVQRTGANEIPQAWAAIDASGNSRSGADGTSWTQSYKYKTSTTAFPTEADVLATGTVIDGRQVEISVATGLALGGSFFVTWVPFSNPSASGFQGLAIQVKATRHDASATKTVLFSTAATSPQFDSVMGFGGHPVYVAKKAGYVTLARTASLGGAPYSKSTMVDLQVPQGCTITGFSWTFDHNASADATSQIVATLDEIGAGNLAVVSTTAIGAQVLSSILSYATAAGKFLVFATFACDTDADVDNEYLKWLSYSVTYTMPSTINAL